VHVRLGHGAARGAQRQALSRRGQRRQGATRQHAPPARDPRRRARRGGCPGRAADRRSAGPQDAVRPLERESGVAATILYSLYCEPQGHAQVPALIAQLAKRDQKLLQGGDGDDDSSGLNVNAGQFFSVECAEELVGLTPEGVRANASPFGAAARQLVETNVQIGVGAPQICGAPGVPATRAKPPTCGASTGRRSSSTAPSIR
jgi:hypothetical protein